MTRTRRGWIAAIVTSIALVSCNAILGNEDRALRTLDVGDVDGAKADHGDIVIGADGGGDGGPDACSPDLQGDEANCGSCGHSCLGGQCLLGKCQPIPVVTVPRAEQVFVVGNTLYFSHSEATNGYLAWCPSDACPTPNKFFMNEDPGLYGMAADAAGVFVVAKGGLVYSFPPRYTTTGQNLLASVSADPPVGAAVDATNSYFTTASGSLFRCGRTSCAGGPALVARGTAPGGAVAVGTTFAVWASVRTSPAAPVGEGFLQQVGRTLNDAGAKTASFGRSPRTMLMKGAALFWTGVDGAYKGEVSYRVDALEGNEVVCLSNIGDPWGIAVDDTHVYFTLPTIGQVQRFPIAGCSAHNAEIIAIGQSAPHGIAVDAKYVYWSTAGSIVRLAK
jgi:hypothetical protein